eukprot:m.1392281 g.1392281  ORF g.1392281 m.1392281 type:complete len:469 (+) comp24991_c0_seq67:3258-4664(+)
MQRSLTRQLCILLMVSAAVVSSWRICDVTMAPFNAVGDGRTLDTQSIRSALKNCDEVVLPFSKKFLTGPLNLTSNQRLSVQGTLLASQRKEDYPLISPVLGYGWGDDENCFPPGAAPHKIVVGSLRYAPVVGAFHAKNISVVGSGTINGQGDIWWNNCTICHYPPHNDSAYCLTANRPKLLEFQFVTGLNVHGDGATNPLTLENSPFWTLTPSYSQNIYVHDLRILAPMNRIGNTDGCNLDSCRNAIIENLYIENSDDGVSMKSGLDGFGMNLAIPTENVLVQNITCGAGGRGGFAIGSEMSGGIRNITFRDSVLLGERGLHLKSSVGRGGYIHDILYENIDMSVALGIYFKIGSDGIPIEPGNQFTPLVSNLRFFNISGGGGCSFDCQNANQSTCFNVTFGGHHPTHCKPPSPSPALHEQKYTCKDTAAWPVCLPLAAPVNNDPNYPNWGPTRGTFLSLSDCQRVCS